MAQDPRLAFLSLNPVLASFLDVVKEVTVCLGPDGSPLGPVEGAVRISQCPIHTRLQSPQQQVRWGGG